jgi:D-lactate dehydrogenase (cytochrome)
LGHVGDGNFHQILIYNPSKPDERKAAEDCVDKMMVEALSMGGTISVRLVTSCSITP